jgi:hypothetical protein
LRGSHGRIGVALDYYGRRAPPREQLAELLGDPPDLRVPGLAADAGQHVRSRQAGRGQEHPGQFGVGVLAGMDEPGLRPQNAYDMRQLDYFRACAYDYGNMR